MDNRANEILNKLSEQEREKVLAILKEMQNKGSSKQFDDIKYADYEEIPVDINTFMHDKQYLGAGLIGEDGKFTVFPYWVKTLNKIFPDNISTNFNTLVLTGGIGLGKSFIAVICGLYILYRLMCLKNPYTFYGLQPIDKITFAFMNITLSAAEGVAWDKCQQLLQSSKWFMERGTISGTSNLTWNPPKGIELIYGSKDRHILGRAVFWCFIDELDFQMNQDLEKQREAARKIVSAAARRMESRFMKGEKNPTLLCLASSKTDQQAFIEKYIEDKKGRNSKTTLIIDEPQWVIRDDKDSPNKFRVAIGNKFLESEIIPDDIKDTNPYLDRGFTILEVPYGYRESFEDNLPKALQDIAGIATSGTNRYLIGTRIQEAKNRLLQNPFTKEIIECGLNDQVQYSEYFDINKIDPKFKKKPLFIHLDMSVSGDKTGIAGVWIIGKRPTVNGQPSNDLYYRLAFAVSIKAPKGYQISFEKHRNFIYWLKNQGFNIRGISTDSFQSVETGQNLSQNGFNYKMISVDRVDSQSKICLPYLTLKNAIYEKRIELIDIRLMTEEFVGLEIDSNGKVDHSPSGINSKDMVDAICGALYHASQHAEEYAFEYGENLINTIPQINSTDQQQSIQNLFQEQLKETFRNKNQTIYSDFGMGKAQQVNIKKQVAISNGILVW